jgi:hypothetical protein
MPPELSRPAPASTAENAPLTIGLHDGKLRIHPEDHVSTGDQVIRYSLRCADDHVFESWFRSAEAFDSLAERRDLACPECGNGEIEKALMAPRVRASDEAPSPAEMIRALRREVEKNSDYVGDRFAAEARAIHEGSAPERSIWGEARRDEAKKLVEDGIPVAPLPFVPQRKMN